MKNFLLAQLFKTVKLGASLPLNNLERLNRPGDREGKPFATPKMIKPLVNSAQYNFVHYGLMLPSLPSPHQYFSIMSFIKSPGALAFDNDHMIKGSPKNTASFVSSTALMEHFESYSIKDECEMSANGELVRFGKDLSIKGQFPNFKVEGDYSGLILDLEIENTDEVTWFVNTFFYKHIGILSKYKGTISYAGETTSVNGLCSFEYAASISPYAMVAPFTDSTLPANAKAPIEFFSYQIIDVDENTQICMADVRIRGGKGQVKAVYVRSLKEKICRYEKGVVFEVSRFQKEKAITPDKRSMALPELFSWKADLENGLSFEINCKVDTPFRYGLGAGYVGGYTYEGQFRGQAIAGRGYIEYIDCREHFLN